MIRRISVLLFWTFIITCLTQTKLAAQAETGQITGTVLDPSGASVPNATVTVKSRATGATRTTTTGSDGSFVITNLLPGLYEISAAAKGFQTTQQLADVAVGSKIGLDIKLQVGVPTEVITVSGTAVPLVNTQEQTLSGVISTQQLSELPTITRNPYDLVLILGNLSPTDPSGRGVGVAINGQRAASTNILLDGASNNDEFRATVGQAVPLDAVHEFSVLTSDFTAQYGRASGGIVNVATKSGTNEFHGTAYEFNRVSRLATNTFNNDAFKLPKSVFTRNQFGYSAGGPIVRDKLFFFQSTEWTRIRSAQSHVVFIPDPAFIAASAPATQAYFNAFGKLRPNAVKLQALTRNDLIAEGADPCAGSIGADLCSALPPTLPIFDRTTFTVPTDAGGGNPENVYNLIGRADWNVSDKTTVYGRYALEHNDIFPGFVSFNAYQGFDTGEHDQNQNALLSVTHSFSPNFVSQSKAVFNRLNQLQPLASIPPTPTLYFNPNVVTTLLGFNVMLPGYNPLSPGSGIPFGGPQNFAQVYEDLSNVRGRHTIRYGGSYVYIRDNRAFGAFENPVAALSRSGVNAQGINNLLAGTLFQFQAAVNPQGKFPCTNLAAPTPDCTLTLPVGFPDFTRSNRYNEVAWYVQDAWRVRPRFTLNLGLRWEYYGVQHNKNQNLDSNFYFGPGSNPFERTANGQVLIAPRSPIGGLWRKDWDALAPRVGIAWDIFGDGKTSFRGGYGIAYERNFGNVTFNVIQNPPNYAVISLISGVDVPSISIPTTVAGPLAGATGTKPLPKTSLRVIDPHIEPAYANFWSASIERQLASNVAVGVDYTGSHGVRLYSIANPNRPGSANVFGGVPCPAPPCFDRLKATQYTNINLRASNGTSYYNALNARVDVRNFQRAGLNLHAAYTWAHALDSLSSTFSESNNDFNLGYLDPFNPRLDYGNAEFDIRSRFVVSGVWDIPFARNTHGIARRVMDGWEIAPIFSAQTGSPFPIFDCTNAVQVCPRMMELAHIPRAGRRNPPPVPGVPNQFNYIDLPPGSFSSTYVNPIVGFSDFGPFPRNMTARNAFYGPGTWKFDLGLYKNFKVTERYTLQFRAEAYNFFNHSNLYEVAGANEVELQPFIPATRGVIPQPAGATPPVLFERRNIQFALKFIF